MKIFPPAQQRNWEELAGLAVIDRQEVILEVFADRAHTREAILQVALARQEYSPAAPQARPGPTFPASAAAAPAPAARVKPSSEEDRRIVRDRIAHLKEQLVEVVRQRGVQRARRLPRPPAPPPPSSATPTPASPPSLNRLTGSSVFVEDKLFATLDPTTRQLLLANNQKLLVTDTVGFIRRLPHGLVEAFKATLEEVVVADFLIHVLDVTTPNYEKHHATTLGVLSELGADNRPTPHRLQQNR